MNPPEASRSAEALSAEALSAEALSVQSQRAEALPAATVARRLTAILAITPAGIIGRDGGLPWRLGTDLRRFKQLTLGGVLIMGRKTYESIGRPLPGRQTIVITRNPAWHADEGVLRTDSPEEALRLAGDRPTFVVGGAEIYRQLLPQCTDLLLTRVLTDQPGDTRLDLDLSQFEILERIQLPAGPRDEVATEFLRLARRNAEENMKKMPSRPH
jgi:dihydrofolate reductase